MAVVVMIHSVADVTDVGFEDDGDGDDVDDDGDDDVHDGGDDDDDDVNAVVMVMIKLYPKL
eukprot:4953124-Pyramimonas_sp.AAC.1